MPRSFRSKDMDRSSRGAEADFSIEKYGERTAEKEECEEQLLAEYATLLGFYLVSAAVLTGIAVQQHRLPRKFGLLDLALLGIATHKLSRIIAKDRITGIGTRAFCELHSQRRRGRSGGRATGPRNPARHRATHFLSILYGAVVRDSSRVRPRFRAARDTLFRWNFDQRSGVGFPSACLSRG